MEKRRLGSSDLAVTPVIYGAWVIGGIFWGGADNEESIGAIEAALDSGVTTIDTAPMYGCGLSEELVGKAIRGRRDDVVIATKCGLRWDSDEGQEFFNVKIFGGPDTMVRRNLRPDSIRCECERSLLRLGVDTIDLYQCHWADPTTPIEDSMAELVKLRDEGKIREIGVSNFSAGQVREARETAPVVSDQPKYSALDRKAEEELLPYCRENNVGVIVYTPMEKGLLTGAVTMDREFPEEDVRHNDKWFQPENRRRVLEALDKIRPIAKKHDATLAQLIVSWTFHQPGITAAIVGGRNAKQASENAGAMKVNLEDSELSEIRKVFEDLGKPK
jgi:aryl-alcohol dehydrogenase-like predicted oxidoreductase